MGGVGVRAGCQVRLRGSCLGVAGGSGGTVGAAASPRWTWHRASRFAVGRPLLPGWCVPGQGRAWWERRPRREEGGTATSLRNSSQFRLRALLSLPFGGYGLNSPIRGDDHAAKSQSWKP